MATIAYYIGENRILVDEEFLPLMQEYRWYCDGKSYISAGIYGKNKGLQLVRLHRVIIDAKAGDIVDHINGNKFDNRRANLRICSNRENLMNRASVRNSASKFKGVQFAPGYNGRKFYAYIKTKEKRLFLGSFDSEEEAARAYDAAAKIHFGKFAWFNFPENPQEEIEISSTHYHVDFKDTTSSKYKGATLLKGRDKNPWQSKIKVNKKTVHLGTFQNQYDAAIAYDKKSWELFKDLSKLNFQENYKDIV